MATNITTSVRLNYEDYEKIRKISNSKHLGISTFIRNLIFDYLKDNPNPEIIKKSVSTANVQISVVLSVNENEMIDNIVYSSNSKKGDTIRGLLLAALSKRDENGETDSSENEKYVQQTFNPDKKLSFFEEKCLQTPQSDISIKETIDKNMEGF